MYYGKTVVYGIVVISFTTFRRKNVPMYAKLCYTYFRITTNKKHKKHKMKESRNI